MADHNQPTYDLTGAGRTSPTQMIFLGTSHKTGDILDQMIKDEIAYITELNSRMENLKKDINFVDKIVDRSPFPLDIFIKEIIPSAQKELRVAE
jgi:hypothetical protein